MRLCLLVCCISTANMAVAPLTTQAFATVADTNNSNNDCNIESETELARSIALTNNSSFNPTETSENITVSFLNNSTEPQCKDDEKVIEDATSCHLLCSKGALFYYSAGRKPEGVECVVNKYLEGTQHIEASNSGECFKGQCRVRNDTSTALPLNTPLPESPTTLASSSQAETS